MKRSLQIAKTKQKGVGSFHVPLLCVVLQKTPVMPFREHPTESIQPMAEIPRRLVRLQRRSFDTGRGNLEGRAKVDRYHSLRKHIHVYSITLRINTGSPYSLLAPDPILFVLIPVPFHSNHVTWVRGSKWRPWMSKFDRVERNPRRRPAGSTIYLGRRRFSALQKIHLHPRRAIPSSTLES